MDSTATSQNGWDEEEEENEEAGEEEENEWEEEEEVQGSQKKGRVTGTRSAPRKHSSALQDEYNKMLLEHAMSLKRSSSGAKDRRVILLGHTGSGKSTAGNAILKKRVFPVPSQGALQAETHQKKMRSVNGYNITVLDTAGLSHGFSSDQVDTLEVVRWLSECAPGPHAFIIVLNALRYSQEDEEERDVYNIQEFFGEEVWKHTVVVLTHGDKLGGRSIAEIVEMNRYLKELVLKCGGRCHGLNGRSWRKNGQIKKLLRTINIMVEGNGGRHYTNETLQALMASVEDEVGEVTQTVAQLPKTVGVKQAIKMMRKKTLKMVAGAVTGAILGSIFGVTLKLAVMILKRLGPSLMGYVLALGLPSLVTASGLAGGLALGGIFTGGALAAIFAMLSINGAVVGAAVGAKAAMDAATLKEAAQLAAKALIAKEKESLKVAWEQKVVQPLQGPKENTPQPASSKTPKEKPQNAPQPDSSTTPREQQTQTQEAKSKDSPKQKPSAPPPYSESKSLRRSSESALLSKAEEEHAQALHTRKLRRATLV